MPLEEPGAESKSITFWLGDTMRRFAPTSDRNRPESLMAITPPPCMKTGFRAFSRESLIAFIPECLIDFARIRAELSTLAALTQLAVVFAEIS